MKYFIIGAAFSAVSYAQEIVVPATDCTGLFNSCLALPNVDVAGCSFGQAHCNQCQSDYIACQTPLNGAPIDQDACNTQLLGCVSSAFPQFQFEPPAPTIITTAAPSTTKATGYGHCQVVYYQCLNGGKKQQLCLCELSTCSGDDTDDSRKSCSSLSVAATATSTPIEYYGSQVTGSSLKELAGGADRESTTSTKNVGSGIAASGRLNLMGLVAALVAPLLA